MLPTAYEFHWDIGHIIFLGVFYTVIGVISVALGMAVHQWLGDLRSRRSAGIAWREACHELPPERRACRHELAGTVAHRTCEQSFLCASCDRHLEFAARGAAAAEAGPAAGLDLPAGRLHHRGHTWVEPQPDGTVKIGVDDLAARCFGRPERVRLPAPGTALNEGDRGARLLRGRLEARLFNPVAGEVVEQGDFTGGYLYRLRPAGGESRFVNLLEGPEASAWMVREMEALQRWVSPAGTPAVADGGRLVDDLVAAYPDADWDDIWGRICLEC